MTTTQSSETASPGNAVDRVAQGAHEIIYRVAEKAGPAVDRVRSGVNSATQAVHSGVEAVQGRVEDLGQMPERWLETSRASVRDHPLDSVGVAVAAGMLISRLTAR